MRRKTIGILAYFKRHNDGFAAKVGYSRAHETYARYRVVCSHLASYIQKKYRRDDIPLSSIRAPFVEGFDTWLRTACGLSSNSVWGYMIALKHIFTLARNEGLMTLNPFASSISRTSSSSER